jgi:carboxymethylenebutenolidase
MVEETLTLSTPDGEMGVHIRRPDGDGPFPVVVYFHHGPGLDDGSKESMQWLADEGYYVISHDRYHREEPWFRFRREDRADQDAFQRFWGILTGTTDAMVDVDVRAVLDHVAADPAARGERLGCIGFCIGARSVVRAMADHPDTFAAGSGLHPSFCTTDQPDSPHLAVPSIPGHLYIAYGAEDKMQAAADNVPFIDAVRAMGDRGTAEILDGADHGFAVPGDSYHEPAAKRAYDQTFAMFDRVLRSR